MARINFPSAPTVDQEFTAPDETGWIWTGTAWERLAVSSGNQYYAGDIFCTENTFTEDGRNLIPCDGQAIDAQFTDLLAVLSPDTNLPYYLSTGLPYKILAQDVGTSGIADYIHPELVVPPLEFTDNANVTLTTSTEVVMDAKASVYTQDILTHITNGFVIGEIEIVSTSLGTGTNLRIGFADGEAQTSIMSNTDYYAIEGSTSGDGYVGGVFASSSKGTAVGAGPGDLVACVVNLDTNKLAIWVNGTLWQEIDRPTTTSGSLFIGIYANAATDSFKIRTNSSRDSHTYGLL